MSWQIYDPRCACSCSSSYPPKKEKEEMTQWEGVGKWFHCSSAPVLSVDSHGSQQVNFVEIYQRWLLWKFIWKLKIYEGGFRENIWIWLVKLHQGAFCGKVLGFQRNEFSGVYRQGLKKEHDNFFYWINPQNAKWYRQEPPACFASNWVSQLRVCWRVYDV